MTKTKIKELSKGDHVRFASRWSQEEPHMAVIERIVTDMTHYRDVAYVKTWDGKQGVLTDNDDWVFVGGKVEDYFFEDEVSNKKQNSSNDVQQKKRFEHLKGNLSRMDRLHGYTPDGVITSQSIETVGPNEEIISHGIQRGKVKLIDSNTVQFENGKQMKVIVNNGKQPTSVYWIDNTTIEFDNGSRVTVPENYETKLFNDIINKPSHYTYGKIEIIEIVEQVTATYPTNIAFSIGNALKYICRAPFKNGVEDLKKAVWYLDRAIKKWEEK